MKLWSYKIWTLCTPWILMKICAMTVIYSTWHSQEKSLPPMWGQLLVSGLVQISKWDPFSNPDSSGNAVEKLHWRWSTYVSVTTVIPNCIYLDTCCMSPSQLYCNHDNCQSNACVFILILPKPVTGSVSFHKGFTFPYLIFRKNCYHPLFT